MYQDKKKNITATSNKPVLSKIQCRSFGNRPGFISRLTDLLGKRLDLLGKHPDSISNSIDLLGRLPGSFGKHPDLLGKRPGLLGKAIRHTKRKTKHIHNH